MIKFEFNNNLVASDNTTKAIASDIRLLDNFSGENGVVEFNNSSIKISENSLNYSSTNFQIDIRLFIKRDAKGNMCLLKGTSIPIKMILFDVDGRYFLNVEVKVNNKYRTYKSKIMINKNEWFNISFALLDGEFLFKINNQIAGRRVYLGEASLLSGSNYLYIGNYLSNDSEVSGFKGYISSIAFYDDVEEELDELADKLNSQGYLEDESKYEDLKIDGIDLGEVSSQKNIKFISGNSAYYTKYKNAVIVWTPGYDCVWMNDEIFNKYLQLIKTEPIGAPISDMKTCSKGDYCLFEYGGIFKVFFNNLLHYVPSDFYYEYITGCKTDDISQSEYGYPTSGLLTYNSGTKQKQDVVMFEKYVMAKNEYDKVINKIDYDLFGYYSKNSSILGNIINIQSNEINVSNSIYYTAEPYSHRVKYMECSNYAVAKVYSNGVNNFYRIPKDFYEEFKKKGGFNGELKTPISNPITTASGKVYQNFMEGIIVKYPGGKIYSHTTLKFELNFIKSGSIDDGVGDKTAELYIEVYVNINGIIIENRWPEYNKAKSWGSSAEILYKEDHDTLVKPNNKKDQFYKRLKGQPVFYLKNSLKGEDVVNMQVKVYDYDKASKNDYLGTFILKFDIENGWGIDSFENINNNYGTHNGKWLDKQGGDNRNGLGNITLNYSVKEYIDVNLDDFFRRDGYWSIDNFKSMNEISHNDFVNAFANVSHVTNWFDYVLNPIDSAWYGCVKELYSGQEGNCFGLSVAALDVIFGKSPYSLPLYRYTPYKTLNNYTMNVIVDNKSFSYKKISRDTEITDDFRYLIKEKHLYQGGIQHLNWVINKVKDGSIFSPPVGFKNIAKTIDRDKYCLINLFGGGGHTVVGYKYEIVNNNVVKIYVANCNAPWWENEYQKDSSYIVLTSSIVKKVELYDNNSYTKTYNYVYETPYSVVSKQPRVPLLLELTATVLDAILGIPKMAVNNLKEFLVMICTGDADIDSVEVGGKSLKVEKIHLGMGAIQIVTGIDVEDEIKVRYRGKQNGSYTGHILSRSKHIEFNTTASKDSLESVTISNFHRRKIDLSMNSNIVKNAHIKFINNSRRRGKGSFENSVQVPIGKAKKNIKLNLATRRIIKDRVIRK